MKDQYMQYELISERGWTLKMIKKYLGEPDSTAFNSNHAYAPPTKLFYIDRIREAEQREDFQLEMKKLNERREKAAQRAGDKWSAPNAGGSKTDAHTSENMNLAKGG